MKRFVAIGAPLALAVLLAACGGGAAEPVSLAFTGTDALQFSPNSASAAAGAAVEVTFNNTGALEHSWTLVPGDADNATVTDAAAVAGAATGVVAAGGSDTITFIAPAAGSYKFVCTVPGHAAGGMTGTFTVN